MTDYGDIFNRVEASLLRVGTMTMAEADIRRNLDTFKDFEGKTFSDAEYYWKLKAVIQGRKFAKAAQHPIRYIDIVFVAYGQMESKEFGLERGICLENDPSCHICGIKDVCHHFARIGP